MLLFPSSVSAQYTTRLRSVLSPLQAAMKEHIAVLNTSTFSPDFSPDAARKFVQGAEGALAPLAMSARLLKRDIVWHRFSGADLAAFRYQLQRLSVAANGMNLYFTLIDPTRERFPTTPAPSHPGTPLDSPMISAFPSRDQSPSRGSERRPTPQTPQTPQTPPAQHDFAKAVNSAKRRSRPRHPHFEPDSPTRSSSRPVSVHTGRHSHSHRHSGPASLIHALHLHGLHHREHVVGVFESQRYLDLESTHFAHPLAARFTEHASELLRESAEGLLQECVKGLQTLDQWLETSRKNKRKFWRGKESMRIVHAARMDMLQGTIERLAEVTGRFKKDDRYVVAWRACTCCVDSSLSTDYACWSRTALHLVRQSTLAH